LSLSAVLRSADEHLDKIVVQRVVKLALKAPFKLRMIKIARMQIKIISMHRHGRVLELNDNFDTVALGSRGKVQQRMFVETELREHAVETGIGRLGHRMIVEQDARCRSAIYS
jgi:hypothetical protein